MSSANQSKCAMNTLHNNINYLLKPNHKLRSHQYTDRTIANPNPVHCSCASCHQLCLLPVNSMMRDALISVKF